jgi:hypothetical protein
MHWVDDEQPQTTEEIIWFHLNPCCVLLGAPLFELKNRMLNESLQKGIAMSQFLLIPFLTSSLLCVAGCTIVWVEEQNAQWVTSERYCNVSVIFTHTTSSYAALSAAARGEWFWTL